MHLKNERGHLRRPYGLPLVVIIVSPSSPQPVVVAVASKESGRYEVLASPIFKYRDVFVLWMVSPIVKYSDVASGPMTGAVPFPGRDWR